MLYHVCSPSDVERARFLSILIPKRYLVSSSIHIYRFSAQVRRADDVSRLFGKKILLRALDNTHNVQPPVHIGQSLSDAHILFGNTIYFYSHRKLVNAYLRIQIRLSVSKHLRNPHRMRSFSWLVFIHFVCSSSYHTFSADFFRTFLVWFVCSVRCCCRTPCVFGIFDK